jgi:hypothetical protein
MVSYLQGGNPNPSLPASYGANFAGSNDPGGRITDFMVRINF